MPANTIPGRETPDGEYASTALEPERRVADWDGTPYVQDSTKHLSVCPKPA